MLKTKRNPRKKNINDYVIKEKFAKCEDTEAKDPIEIKMIISKLSLDCLSKSSDQGKKLKELFSIIESKVHGKSIILRKSVLVSLCLIFKDILPTYKIVVLTEQQKQQSMKNETIKCYSDEEILLSYYHKYIRIMESVLKKQYDIESMNHVRWTESDELVLLKCACRLFVNNPSFNYSSTLLELIVPNLNSTNSKFLKYSSNAIQTTIKDDIKLERSLIICETIKQYIVEKKFNVRSTLINPFMIMELEDINVNRNDKVFKKNSLQSRKQKKDNKKNKKYNQHLDQISAKESLDIKYTNNSLIIRSIFYIYFRVLKKNNISAKLLEGVLNGIGKYGRLVNCELFSDIFVLLKKICDNSKISIENRLLSLFVSLDIVTSGKASEILDVDPGNYTNKLLKLAYLQHISPASSILIVNCCTKLLVKRRNYVSKHHSEEIIKMLINLAWNQQNSLHICSMVLVSLVRYLRIYPNLQYLFDDESEVLSDHEVFHENERIPQHETLKQVQDLCKLSIYEVSGIAKEIKKFFLADCTTLLELKGELEDLTRMKTEDCMIFLKGKLYNPLKRQIKDENDKLVKKIKIN